MLSDIAPFRLAGNIYFVGTRPASAHVIDTGDGLILIDTGYEETAPVILESMQTLGLDIADVKIILHSHGHRDHVGGTKELLNHCKAETYLHVEDHRYLKGKSYEFIPDHSYNDGDVITLGNTSITVLHTPGHTEGTVSFFWNVEVDGKTYRAGMFGGAGTNQLKKDFLIDRQLSFLLRGYFFDSIERLKNEKVDIFVGNHAGQNHTRDKLEKIAAGCEENPFIDPAEFGRFLCKTEKKMHEIMEEESRTRFVNYAHRGASHYMPENTMSSFRRGLEMEANGIETDVQITSDSVPVLFHDDTTDRVTGKSGSIPTLTFDELRDYPVSVHGKTDVIPTVDEFFTEFSDKEITFAIELKQENTADVVASLVYKYGIEKKCVITSFKYEEILSMRRIAPELKTGYLTREVSDELFARMRADGLDEYCPEAQFVDEELVKKCHRLGFNVRAWGVYDEDLMKKVYDAGADGMTVNFPDKLTEYIKEKRA